MTFGGIPVFYESDSTCEKTNFANNGGCAIYYGMVITKQKKGTTQEACLAMEGKNNRKILLNPKPDVKV